MTEDRPRLLLIGMGTMGRPYVSRAHGRGFAVSVVDHEGALGDPEVERLWEPGDRTYRLTPGTGFSDQAWYLAAGRAMSDETPAAVIAFTEPHVLTAAMIAEELRLPGPGMHAAMVSRNKALQRALFARHDIRQPEFHLAADVRSARDWAAGRYPVVLKPLTQSGSRDVRVVTDAGQLDAWTSERDDQSPFLCEEFVPGPEVSCELILHEHRVVFTNATAKSCTQPPYCVELGHQVPAGIGRADRDALDGHARRVVEALDMADGIAHVEARMSADGPCLMEVAVRMPGDYIMELVEMATGVDLFDAVVATATGRPPPVDRTRDAAAGVWFPPIAPATTLPSTELEALTGQPGVVRVDVDAHPGSKVPPLRWSRDRVGAVLLRADRPEELAQNMRGVQRALAGRLSRGEAEALLASSDENSRDDD